METRSDKSQNEARVTGDTHVRNFTNMDSSKTTIENTSF